jgi:hypothetical protein
MPPAAEAPLRVVVKPFAIPLGAASPASAEGYFDLAEYNIGLRGDAELTRLMGIARATGIGTPTIGLAGKALIDFAIAGAWTGFAPPVPLGKLQVRDAVVELQGVLQPMEVNSASVALADQAVTISSFSAAFKDGPAISGSASFPLRCSGGDTCLVRFDLRTPDVSLAEINQLVNPSLQSSLWYHLLATGQRDNSALLKFHGRGRVSAGRLNVAGLSVTNVSANLEMNAGALNIRELKADVLGGQHTGNWDADFSSPTPKFYGSGFVTKMVMAQVSSQMHDPWATGTLTGQYTIGLSGLDNAQLRDSATGSANFEWTGGSLRHLALEGMAAPLSFTSFKGDIALRNGTLTCQQCGLKSQGASYTVGGSADLNRSLDLRLERPEGASYAITGPLDNPHVGAISAPSVEAQQR